MKKPTKPKPKNKPKPKPKPSAATPDGCRSNYESINKEEYEKTYQTKTEEQTEA